MYLGGNIPESSTYNNQTPVHGWFDLLMKSYEPDGRNQIEFLDGNLVPGCIARVRDKVVQVLVQMVVSAEGFRQEFGTRVKYQSENQTFELREKWQPFAF